MPTIEAATTLRDAVLHEALTGLTSTPKTLTPWLFYDEAGSHLFDAITDLPEYYLTRTERALFAAHADEILTLAADGQRLTLLELGAGSSSKTGILLEAAVAQQGSLVYQPIDVSSTALDEAAAILTERFPGVTVAPQVANYITEGFTLTREPGERVLSLYIGSSIGNFSPAEASGILQNLRDHLHPGDSLLLGCDLAPGPHKSVDALLAAYDDAAGVTAAFNKNILHRLTRELDADFRPEAFAHRSRWNPAASRIEMHLESLAEQTVHIDGKRITFASGETIHTENSCKFTEDGIATLLASTGFAPTRTWTDSDQRFAVTLAESV